MDTNPHLVNLLDATAEAIDLACRHAAVELGRQQLTEHPEAEPERVADVAIEILGREVNTRPVAVEITLTPPAAVVTVEEKGIWMPLHRFDAETFPPQLGQAVARYVNGKISERGGLGVPEGCTLGVTIEATEGRASVHVRDSEGREHVLPPDQAATPPVH